MINISRTVPANTSRSKYNFSARFGGAAMALQPCDPDTVRIHLTHACSILRIGMATVLSGQANLDVTESEFAPEKVDQDCIIITDYATGMHVMAEQGSMAPGLRPRVLIVTTRDKEWEVRHAVDSGVRGYLLQSCAAEELLRCVRLLSRGVGYLSATVVRSVSDSLGRVPLTRRENDVLQLMARGDSNKHIASELGISLLTVKTHVAHLLQKLNATARTQAVAVAMSRGLLMDQNASPSPTDAVPDAAQKTAWSALLQSASQMTGTA